MRADIVFTRRKVAVFVDGCYWHGCPDHCRLPARNRDYWSAKITRNRARDGLVTESLRAAGWQVTRIWEHEPLEGPWRASSSHCPPRSLRCLRDPTGSCR